MEQAPYPPPAVPSVYDLSETDKITTEEIHHKLFLLAFIYLCQLGTLGTLPAAVFHTAEALLQSYIKKVIQAITGPPWSREALENAIKMGPMHQHAPQRG